MKALVCDEPGRLSLVDRQRPVRAEGEILVRIRHVGICGTDLHEYLEGPIFCPKPGHPHPITGEEVPVWVGNYVLMSYGDGAVMGVPAHDERDFEFATAFGLPTPRVVTGGDDRLWRGESHQKYPSRLRSSLAALDVRSSARVSPRSETVDSLISAMISAGSE